MFAVCYVCVRLWIVRVTLFEIEDFRINFCWFSYKWFIVALLLPVIKLTPWILFKGNWLSDFTFVKFVGIVISGMFEAAVVGILFCGLVLSAVELLLDKTIAVVLTSVVFACLNIELDFGSFINFVYSFGMNFAFAVMLMLITEQSENAWNGILIYSFILILNSVFCFGTEASSTALFNYVVHSGKYVIKLLDCALVLILVGLAFFWLNRKKQRQIFYW